MRIDILTLFPEMVDQALSASIIGRGREAGLLDIRCHNIRDYSPDKRRRTDDYPYGGGASRWPAVWKRFSSRRTAMSTPFS